jgi:hypothetical protein
VQVPLFLSPGWRLVDRILADGGVQYLVYDTATVSKEQARELLDGTTAPGVYVAEAPDRRFHTTTADLEEMHRVRAVSSLSVAACLLAAHPARRRQYSPATYCGRFSTLTGAGRACD